MSNHLLREYDTVIRGSRTGWQGEDFFLESSAFDALASLLERDDPGSNPGSNSENLNVIASFTRVRKKDAIKFRQWVGLIRLPDGTTLEILPKTHERGDDPTACRELLKKMLRETDERFRVAPPADLDPSKMPLFEVFLSYALAGFRHAIRRGVPHRYVPIQEERAGLRGRLNLTRQIRQLPSRAHLLHVEFDEYLPDRPETRLVRLSLEHILKLTTQQPTKRGAREAMAVMDGVPISRNIPVDLAAWRLDRSNLHFAPLEALCRLVLFELNPLVGGETVRAISAMFDMNRVYESYVAWFLKQQHPDWIIRTQVKEESLGEVAGRPVFKLKPDLLITLPDGETIVADTKWKRLKPRDSGYYGVSEADAYQMLAYSLKYQSGQPNPRLWLLYPRVHGVPERIPTINLPEGRTLEIQQLTI
jgi:5-methylcytosine-specific restriction enzyme subunit McrC